LTSRAKQGILRPMSQPFLFQPVSITVSELNRYLRQLLESDDVLQEVWVIGEVSNLSRPASGHLYFTLKDSTAAIRCVMWRSMVQRLRFSLRDGMSVEVNGSIRYYEVAGQVQIEASLVRPAGEGALYQEFLRLKARLEAEGLFDPERKRPIPGFPHRIGIVTSPTGAALQDMLNTIRRRFPLVEVFLSPTPVQGNEAPPAIVAAIERLNRLAQPDVILVARGGGSLEDLWAFNDERVARAIVASKAPVISGVGHETDFTIADFAADLRAPTPTAAAELATPDQADLRAALSEELSKLGKALGTVVANQRWRLSEQHNRLHRFSPLNQIRSSRQRVDELAHRSALAVDHSLRLQGALLTGLSTRLAGLSPQSILNRGYAVVSLKDGGEVVNSLHQVAPGDALQVRVKDGEFGASVTK
jgi:exodeoxyribonuclease VII large subunit